jgi:hypothetical protein
MLSGVFDPRLLSSDRSKASSVSLNREYDATPRQSPRRPRLVSNVTPMSASSVAAVAPASAAASGSLRDHPAFRALLEEIRPRWQKLIAWEEQHRAAGA